MDNTEKFFVECVKAALNEQRIAVVPDEIDYKKLYILSTTHSVSVMVFNSLTDVFSCLPKGFQESLENAVKRHVVKDIQSTADAKKVITAFEENDVKFMPLKGYHLKNLYPSPDYRYTSDFDILIDKKELNKIRGLYEKLGLKVERFDEHHDIVYFENTKTIFELHKMLFVGKLDEYFKVGFEKAHLKSGYKSFYELNPEDFYMTLLGHSAYHFAHSGGVGIRHLTDIFVYKKTYKLDYEYLDCELKKSGLYEFKNEFENLVDVLFNGKESDEFTDNLISHVLSSSVLANEEKKNAGDVASYGEKGKMQALFRLVFPKKENMQFTYPVLKKCGVLLPLFYVVRWFRVIFKTPDSLTRIKAVSSVDEKETENMKEIKNRLNINKI